MEQAATRSGVCLEDDSPAIVAGAAAEQLLNVGVVEASGRLLSAVR